MEQWNEEGQEKRLSEGVVEKRWGEAITWRAGKRTNCSRGSVTDAEQDICDGWNYQ